MSFILKLPGTTAAYQSEKRLHIILQQLLGQVIYNVRLMKRRIVPTFTEIEYTLQKRADKTLISLSSHMFYVTS